MEIKICVDENLKDMEVIVNCRQLTPEVEKLLANLRMMKHQLTVKKDDEIYLLDIAQIIYIENVERKCFVYTAEQIYESDFRLYELEQKLSEYQFIRISKSGLANLSHIQSLRAEINRKIRVTMSNGEQIIVSRQYAEELKKRLGL